MPEQAFATIKVKLGHPTGEYRRGGHLFTVAEPVILPAEEVTEEIASDGWLVVTFGADAPAEGLEAMTRAALDAHALTLGIDTSNAKNKDEAIERIKAASPASTTDVSAETLKDLQAELDAMRARAVAAEEELGKLTGHGTTASSAGATHQVNATSAPASDRTPARQSAPSPGPQPTPGDGSDKTAGTVSGASTVNPVNSTTVPPVSGPGAKS